MLNTDLFTWRDVLIIGVVAIVVHALMSPLYSSIDNGD